MYDCSPRLHGYAADLTYVDTTCTVMARVGGRDALERAIQVELLMFYVKLLLLSINIQFDQIRLNYFEPYW